MIGLGPCTETEKTRINTRTSGVNEEDATARDWTILELVSMLLLKQL